MILKHSFMSSILLLLLLSSPAVMAEQLRFKQYANEKYRIITEVFEQVLINGRLSHNSNILNKVSVTVAALTKTAAQLNCIFQTSEGFYKAYPKAAFVLKRNYGSSFQRDWQGKYTIDGKYFMPVLRDIPVFPEDDLKPGMSWTRDATEAHDLRRGYNIQTPFILPIKVNYTYQGNKTIAGKNMAIIKVQYMVFYNVPQQFNGTNVYPVKITGSSDKIILWDIAAGNMDSFKEDFDFIFHLSNGSYVEYKGIARGKRIPSPKLDKEKVAAELRKKLNQLGVEGSIKISEKGVTIVMDNIGFQPYSDHLLASETAKLDRLAAILQQFAARDLLITGHTARSGSERTSQLLSENRARVVGNYLLQKKAAQRSQLVIKGMGSKAPVAPNDSEANMKKNRRVEITILEN